MDQGIVDTELVCNPDRDGGAITTAPSTTPVPTTVRTTTTGIAFTTTTEAVTESTEGFTTTDVQTLEPVIEPRFLITCKRCACAMLWIISIPLLNAA